MMMSWRNKKLILVFCVIILFFSGSLVLVRCGQSTSNRKEAVNEYVGDQACISCHKAEYGQWQLSDHYKAMQPATDSTVLGDFNNVTYTADGITSRFFKKGGKFFINTQGPDGQNHDYEIKYTFGYYPLQQYLVAFDRGRMQATRQSWNSKDKKWFQQYAGQKIAATDWLHWTGNGQNWNTMCAECHSTNLKKNYNSETDTYNTTFSVLTVSCEACHGPAKSHIDYVNGSDYKNGNHIAGSYLRAPKNSTQLAQIQTCFPCHARKSNISADLKNSNEILDDYIPDIPTTEHFYADGQANDEDYTYTSFLQSKMYNRGVKCSNCHNPHTGKLLVAGNGVCLQCHDKKYDAPSHTFHTINTDGAACKNCHMPGKYYMGNDWRNDHTFRVPRPDLSVTYGTPNACNNCHTNKSAQWASDAVVKWFGPTRPHHFSEDLIPGSKLDAGSQAHLMRLIQDTATPSIVQAAAVQYLSNAPGDNNATALIQEFSNKDAQVRYRAVTGLSSFSPGLWKDAIQPMLVDKVRAVRIAAANLVLSANDRELIAGLGTAYTNALQELEANVLYQTDFSAGDVIAADYYLKLKNYDKAESFYLKGLQKDDQMNYARLNLSTVYNLKGNNQAALQTLLDAARIDPKNDRIYFNLALLYNELQQPDNVEKSLQKAISLKSANPRVYYNYGILLQQKKQYTPAEQQYKKALELAPADADINYALCVLYLQQNNPAAARSYAQTLKKYYPGDQRFFQLWQQLGLL
ncbi:tetratricopeptide repeat protein [Niabella soli]|nr:tetratricopeptide repeat protein [Niabella soli]